MQPHNDFHHFHYSKVVDFDSSSVATDAQLPARLLKLRAQIASGQSKEVLAEIKSEAGSSPDLGAVQCLALWESGKTDQATKQAEKLATENSDDATVQVLAGTVLHAAGKSEEALALLAKHQGSLEAVALATQIHLSQNRTDLALKEVQAARKWAQDSLLVNIAESWVGLRIGGDRYQQAFYEFEEMPVCQSVAEIHLGRLPEAEAALQQVLKENPEDVQAVANSIVLNMLSGKDTTELTK
jgi:coatomer subunit epsilon